MKRDMLDDAVALVEDAEHRDPLRHRRHSAFAVSSRSHLLRRRKRRIRLLGSLPAGGGQRERNQQRCGTAFHYYSGIQGS
jgi:hypothetical protein